jgi:hypothetical protein
MCIGEAFVQNSMGGGVAFMGNTRTGWGGTPEDPDHYSVLQDRLLYDSLYDQGIYCMGDCFSYLKNNAYEGPDPYNLCQYTFTQMTLLGDPGVFVWTEDPQALTVTHDDSLPFDEYSTFSVQVMHEGSPVDEATVCLWKDGDLYEVGSTDPSGTVSFGVTPGTLGRMDVTVTKHNYLPYEGHARVKWGNTPIPTVSEWGMIAMGLLIVAAGATVFARRRPARI